LAKLAQAIVHGPRLLILDEPTNGLDPPARQRMIRLIREMRDAGNMHILLCSHLLRDVEETCHEVLILKKGRIVYSCDLNEQRAADKNFLRLETVGDSAWLPEALEGLGCRCTAAGAGRFQLDLPAHFALRDLYRLADSHKLELRRVEYRRDSLQTIFLAAMEQDGDL
jgi:ABC-2 type transport system ATP-binding protein